MAQVLDVHTDYEDTRWEALRETESRLRETLDREDERRKSLINAIQTGAQEDDN